MQQLGLKEGFQICIPLQSTYLAGKVRQLGDRGLDVGTLPNVIIAVQA